MKDVSSQTYDPTPESYLKGNVGSAILPHEQLIELSAAIASDYAEASNVEILTRPCSDEERLVLESILRFIDINLANTEGQYSGPRKNRMSRVSTAISLDILEFGFTDIDLDDLRQEARISALFQLRRHNPKRLPSPLAPIGHTIASRLAKTGGRALKFGFSVDQTGPKSEIEFTSDYRLSELRNHVFISSTEGGYSDRVQKLYAHPDFIYTVPLLQIPEEPDNEYEWRRQPPENRPLVPNYDEVDEESASMLQAVERESSNSETIDAILNVVEQLSTKPLKEKEIIALRMYFEQGMTYKTVGEQIGEKIGKDKIFSKQAIHVLITRALSKIRESKGVMEALEEIKTD